jgi:hypothetical protein
MKETNISCMKYRKATHLSGLDVAEIIQKNGSCVVTIKEAFYDRAVDVAGKKIDGYFITFQEPLKDMMLNSVNRKTISRVVKMAKNISLQQASMLNEWVGAKLELYFDEDVKMKGQIVGGIRVKPTSPIPDISDEQAIKLLSECTTLDELQQSWGKLTGQEKALPTVASLKENLKKSLQNGK